MASTYSTTITAPNGWTTDKEEMGYDIYWAKKTGMGQRMAKRHGLEWATAIMRDKDAGDCMFMFQSGNKCYLWNPIEGGIWEIMLSMDVVEIVKQIDKLGPKSLPVKEIDQISSC